MGLGPHCATAKKRFHRLDDPEQLKAWAKGGSKAMFRDSDQHPALSPRTSLDLEISPNQSQKTNQGSEAAEKAGDSELFAVKITEMCRSAWLLDTES